MTGVLQPRSSEALRVVLAPDVVGGLWLEPACARIFELWRDAKLLPVVNRDLLVRYVRLWRALGLSEVQVRRWSWWFTSPVTASFLSDDHASSSDAVECCTRLALVGRARQVIHRGTTTISESAVQWLKAADILPEG
jgi:hypothetical protein